MTRPRTPRTHDAAILALRKRALQLVKGSENADINIRFNLVHHAAAMDYAADYLASIVGVVERKPAKRKGRK